MAKNVFRNFDDNKIDNMMNNKEVQDMLNSPKAQEFMNNNDFGKFKDKYKDKSNDEILKDAKEYSQKLKSQLGEEEFSRKLKELKKFEMFLNKEQKDKLNDFLNQIK